jgi:hypothetical protein
VIQVPKNLGKKRQHASVAVEVDTDAGDDNEETFEAYDGYMDDEPWSDEEDDMRKGVWIRDRADRELEVHTHVCAMTTKFSVATYFAMSAFLYIVMLLTR